LSVLLISAGYLSYAISKCVFLLCALPLAVVLLPFPATKRRVLQGLLCAFLGFFTRKWLPLLRVYRVAEISGLDNTRLATPAIIVANHRGFMDGLFILGLVPHTGVVIKSLDTRQPTYAVLERHFDVVAVDRQSTDSVSAALERCRMVLRRNANLLVFPEGSRARSGRLQRFTRTAFQLAISAQVQVLPVAIHSTHPFMAKVPGSIFPRGRNTFRIQFLAPEPPLQPEDDAGKLSDRVYRRLAHALGKLDVGTCWEVGREPSEWAPAQEPVRHPATEPLAKTEPAP
jgi:1-acyl-sn-glycerol-3-phosphate acyltransferase